MRHAAVTLALAGCGDAPRETSAPAPSPCRPASIGEWCQDGEFEYLRAGRGKDLIVVLHGVGGTAADTAQTSLLHEGGDATVVYPSWAGEGAAYFERLLAKLAPLAQA